MSKISVVLVLLLFGFSAWAIKNGSVQSFKVEYDKHSKVKRPSLKNREMLIQLHSHGNSTGRIKTITDDKQNFSVNTGKLKHPIVHILSIEMNGKTLPCRGVSEPGKQKITIKCRKK